MASPSSMHDTGCLGLVRWDDPEGWYGEGGGSRVQDGEHMYTKKKKKKLRKKRKKKEKKMKLKAYMVPDEKKKKNISRIHTSREVKQ